MQKEEYIEAMQKLIDEKPESFTVMFSFVDKETDEVQTNALGTPRDIMLIVAGLLRKGNLPNKFLHFIEDVAKIREKKTF